MKIQVNTTTNYTIRRETYEGREHIVVPVVMMVEGVHSGSHGPLLHTTEELSRNVQGWNGRPVVLRHPEDEQGNYISANAPEVLQKAIGKVFNTHIDGDKLKAECWLDTQRMAAHAPMVAQYLEQQRPIEVSIGAFLTELQETGMYHNENYEGVATNLVPDHLALLPGEQGACSWVDGCGIRVNSVKSIKTNEHEDMTPEQEQAIKELIYEGFTVNLVANQQSFEDLMRQAQRKLDAMDTEMAVHFLVEMYDGFFIYRKRLRESGTEELYRQNYTVDNAEQLQFNGDPVRVRREVSFPTVNKMIRTKKPKNEEDHMATNAKPCCEEKVNTLIANKSTHWTEADREWLLTQDAATLDKMLPVEPEPAPKAKTEGAPAQPAVNTEDFIRKDSLKTAEDFINLAPPEVQDQMRSGLRLHANRRKTLIQSIVANAKEGVWAEADLEKFDMEMLEKLNSQFEGSHSNPAPVDYSGTLPGARPAVHTDSPEPMAPAGVEFDD